MTNFAQFPIKKSEETIEKYFRCFQTDIQSIELPQQFNFPFVIDTHPLCELALKELQNYLETTKDFTHDFGITTPNEQSIGKMFGVLVVEKPTGELGYLAAFSGKLANSNHISFFVPPVFDMLTENSFFVEEEKHLNRINAQIESIEKDENFLLLKERLNTLSKEKETAITQKKQRNKQLKNERKEKRLQFKNMLSAEEYTKFENDLIKQSLRDKHELRILEAQFSTQINEIAEKIQDFEFIIQQLKKERQEKSNQLQQKLFHSYNFLNAKGERKDLLDIFKKNVYSTPPSGAGECCAPKLLQMAYLHNLKPLAIAEFWWGVSPKSEVKKHRQIYPACWGKCMPILSFMMDGLEVKENPLLVNPAEGKELPIVYDDPYIVVVNKPAEFLSVPGINVHDSVYERIKNRYPNATGPLIVHRLDMSTSGIMILAKTKEVHKHLQQQFIKHKTEKQYIALLDGEISAEKTGIINLPLILDIDDRPKQKVCFDYGKKAVTKYEILEIKNGTTRIAYTPITGRTHQLRMHSAHALGLNIPIKGDDLYGTPADRLYLHAKRLKITHPITQKEMIFEAEAEF